MIKKYYTPEGNSSLRPRSLVMEGNTYCPPTDEQLLRAGWRIEEAEEVSYTPSASELRQQEIYELRQHLAETDYKAIKYAEGWLTDAEYAETKARRQQWRDRINELEKEG